MKQFGSFIKSAVSSVVIGILNIIIAFSSLRNINPFGIAIMLIGELVYGFNQFFMGESWSAKVEPRKRLVKTGLFRYIRHPLYLGATITSFGLAFTLMSIPALIYSVIIVIPFVYYRAKMEEELLSKTMKGYKEYMKDTGMFFPKLR